MANIFMDGFSQYPDGPLSAAEVAGRYYYVEGVTITAGRAPGKKAVTGRYGGVRRHVGQLDRIVVGCYLWSSGSGTYYNAGNEFLFFANKLGASATIYSADVLGDVRLHEDRSIAYSGTIARTAPNVVIDRRWHHVEVDVTFHPSAGRVEIRVDGVTAARAEGIDTMLAGGTCQAVYFRPITSSSKYTDIHIHDATDPVNNTFTGPARVDFLAPATDHSVSFGRFPATSASNAENVDDTAGGAANSDDDATYNEAAAGTDLFDLQPVSYGGAVVAVQLTSRAKKADDATRLLHHVVRSGTVDGQAAGIPLTVEYQQVSTSFDVDPATGAPWTGAAASAIRAGYRAG